MTRPPVAIAIAVVGALTVALLAGCTASTSTAGPRRGRGDPAHTTRASHRINAGLGTSGTDRVVTEPADGLGSTYRLISSARHHLDMTMYELIDTNAEARLAADAARGVDVRVVLDRNLERTRNTAAFDYLNRHGVHVHWAPRSYDATHQKTIVVDDRMAEIMTLNLVSEYYADTRDFAVIDRNHRDVDAIEAVFSADYAGRSSVATPDGADLVWSPGSEPPLAALIRRAQRSLLVESEEMSNAPIVNALCAAARRGVEVEITMTNDDGDYARQFDQLRRAGGHVHVYAYDASLYIHAKAIVVDDRTVWIGSTNFSTASLDYNRELGIVVTSPSVVSSVAATLKSDFRGGKPWR